MSEATIILSNRGQLSMEQATAPGQVSMLMPVPAGMAEVAFKDPKIGPFLEEGCAVILVFDGEADAHEFTRLLAAARTKH